MPLEFDIGDGAIVKSLISDPWNVARRGVMIKPFTSWWDPSTRPAPPTAPLALPAPSEGDSVRISGRLTRKRLQ